MSQLAEHRNRIVRQNKKTVYNATFICKHEEKFQQEGVKTQYPCCQVHYPTKREILKKRKKKDLLFEYLNFSKDTDAKRVYAEP